jgi:penicillin-binding protein 2
LIAGIGQGYTLITPLQMAHSTAVLASYGKSMQPRIVGALENANSGEIKAIFPIEEKPIPIKNKENWDKVLTAMERVVHHWRGTAFRAIGQDVPYKIGGKTGTAQVFSVKQDEEYDEEKVDERLRDHALFIAFAPVDAPRIAVAVIVENGGHGGSTAAPIARKVMDYYLLELEKMEFPAKTDKKTS